MTRSPSRTAALFATGCAAAAFFIPSCSSDSSTAVTPPISGDKVRDVHEFQYDPVNEHYIVRGDTVTVAEVRRDLVGTLCGRCHRSSVDQLKDSVHYKIAGESQRVLFPGGGAHGMLDRACGLPATTGLTNYTSDVNLGECAKCHVGRYPPMMEGFFARSFAQMGVHDPIGEAAKLVDAGIDCLICHSHKYTSVPADGELAAIAGTGTRGGDSPTSTGAARASRDNTDFDRDGQPDLVIDMDGDGTPDAPLMFDSDGDGKPDTPWPTVAQDRSLEAIASIGPTTEHACLRCHEHARTGYKRGTLFIEGHDHHASLNTGVFKDAENRCTVCHTAHQHKFVRGHTVGGDLAAADYPPPPPGTAHDPSDPTDLSCVKCHDFAKDPYLTQVHIPTHIEKIACETCHIPSGSGITYSLFGHGGQVSFARNKEGKDTRLVVADMYVAGDRADLDVDFEAYRTDPILVWFDGGTSFLAQTLAARGMPNAKITPFKPMANGMMFDARYFSGATVKNAAGADYNAHSMYRFFANGANAEAFSALGMIGMTPDAVRRVTMADFQNPDPSVQAMALMLVFPNLVYFDKVEFGYEHYLTPIGSPFDADKNGIIDSGSKFNFDMLAAANSGLRQFAAFNGPMGFKPDYQWYPEFDKAEQLVSMKLPDGSLIKMFLQMQASKLPPQQQKPFLDAIANYPSFSQITLGGHGVAAKTKTLRCIECHGVNGALNHKVPVGRKVLTNMGSMGNVELPVYGWKFYNVNALVDLGLRVTCEDIVERNVDVDIDGDPVYLRESANTFVVNWFMPNAPGGYHAADSTEALKGTSLTAADLSWNGGTWMPVLEPVTEAVPNYKVLGLDEKIVWNF